MPTLEPDNNNNNPLPDFKFDTPGGLSAEQSFQATRFKMEVDGCRDADKVKAIAKQLIDYYFHSQSLIKSLALKDLARNSTLGDVEKIQVLKNAKSILSKAQELIDEEG